jgi:hypothetical protein
MNYLKPFMWMKDRVRHKLQHFSLRTLRSFLKKNGLAFVVIFIIWEIIEDIIFPGIFIWLGNNVNPWFITGAPISWILCLHPIAVPTLWAIWVKYGRGKKNV